MPKGLTGKFQMVHQECGWKFLEFKNFGFRVSNEAFERKSIDFKKILSIRVFNKRIDFKETDLLPILMYTR